MKIDVSTYTTFKSPEAPEVNKISDGESKSTTVASNPVTPSKEMVPPVVYVTLIPQQRLFHNLQKNI